MGLGAGSWSQASRTARLLPWLASDAGLPYQIGNPTTEAESSSPRFRLGSAQFRVNRLSYR